MSEFCERLKELRRDRNLSIQTLARETGLTSSSICRWELKQADIKSSQLIILAKYFNVTTDYLLGLE